VAVREPQKVLRARERVTRTEGQEGLERVQEVICEPSRLRIVSALNGDQLSVSDLAAAIERKIPATSQHLRVLRELGIVEGERRARTVYYRLRRGPAVEQVQTILDALGHADSRAV
jgi:DNA-binding transcriptional ArsR family regulator